MFSPSMAVLYDPVEQRSLKSNIMPRFLALDPFMPQDFLALCYEFQVEQRVLD
jgi:hypothetical protein